MFYNYSLILSNLLLILRYWNDFTITIAFIKTRVQSNIILFFKHYIVFNYQVFYFVKLILVVNTGVCYKIEINTIMMYLNYIQVPIFRCKFCFYTRIFSFNNCFELFKGETIRINNCLSFLSFLGFFDVFVIFDTFEICDIFWCFNRCWL